MAKIRNFDRDNDQSARIILADPERYAGLPLEWARLWMSRQGIQRKKPVSASMAEAEEVTHVRIATS
jgi:hypothetical protein